MKATVRDLRYQVKGIMEAVDRGETVLITRRGKVRARIVRADETEASDPQQENPFVGMWRDRADMMRPAVYVRALRRGRFS
jgi:prevent-host-death family protein